MMLRKAPVKLDFEKLAVFRPPALVSLYIALLKAVQITCLLTSVLLVMRYFRLTGNLNIGVLALVVFLTHLGSFYRHLFLEEHYIPDSFFAKLGELIFLILGLRLVLLFFGEVSPLINLDFIYFGICVAIAWYSGLTFLHQFYNLYLQPYEVAEEDGGVPGLGDNYHVSYDHSQAYRELKGNFQYLAGVQIVVVLAGVSAIQQIHNNPAEAGVVPQIILLGGIYLLLGLPLLAWARMRYIRTLWQLDKLAEPSRLVDRWVYYLGGLVLLVVVVTLGVTALGGVFTLPLPSGGKDQPVFSIFYPPTPVPRPTTPPPTPGRPGRSGPGLDLSWLGVVFQIFTLLVAIGFVIMVLWYAFTRLFQAGWVGPQWGKLSPGKLWEYLRLFIRNIFGEKREKDPFERTESEKRSGFNPFGWLQRDRLPDDARGQVRYYYRQVAQRAGRAGLPRRTGQTPQEYAGYLAPNLEAGQDQASLDNLTGLYEEARFSPHPVDPAQAEVARASSQGLVAFFRQRSRQARQKPRE